MITRLSLAVLFGCMPLRLMAEGSDNQSIPPLLSSGPVDVGSIFQVIAALLVIIFLIIALSWLYRKYGFTVGSNNQCLKVVSALSLGGKEKVILLQVGNEQILLGVSPGYVRKVHVLDGLVPESESQPVGSFISNLNNEIRKVIKK